MNAPAVVQFGHPTVVDAPVEDAFPVCGRGTRPRSLCTTEASSVVRPERRTQLSGPHGLLTGEDPFLSAVGCRSHSRREGSSCSILTSACPSISIGRSSCCERLDRHPPRRSARSEAPHVRQTSEDAAADVIAFSVSPYRRRIPWFLDVLRTERREERQVARRRMSAELSERTERTTLWTRRVDD